VTAKELVMLTAYTTALPPSALPVGPDLLARIDGHPILGGLVVVLAVLTLLRVRARRTRGAAVRATPRLRLVDERAARGASRAA
jgi:hypothetical protein